MLLNAFRAAYRRFGPRYPRLVTLLLHQVAHLVVLAGIGLLTLYQPLGDLFWEAVLVAQILMLLENVLAIAYVSRLMQPLDRWLRGDRSPEAVAEAWRCAASLPYTYTRRWKSYPILFNALPFCAYVTWQLGLPWTGLLGLFAGGLVVLTYGLFLRFFALELALRPLIEDISARLPADFPLHGRGLSLRARLMIALPALNVITGVIVAGFTAGPDRSLQDLGPDVAIALLVSFSVSLELTYLLARSIADPIGDLQHATARVRRGELDVRVPVASLDETGQLAQSFNAAVSGLAERERLREAFGAFVDPEVAERVLREGVALEGEDVEVTVLFLDIRGFTARAERASARELVALLNGFWSQVVPVVTRHRGHANKFVGDGLLAVFGAPERLPDHADRGVAAALEIERVVRERWRGEIRIGIGVNSGPVVAGTVGGGGRVEFTVIGDPVNTAARVEEATRVSGDDVLVTAGTRALLQRDFGGWDERPPVPLRGKSEPVPLFAPRVLARGDGRVGALSVDGGTG